MVAAALVVSCLVVPLCAGGVPFVTAEVELLSAGDGGIGDAFGTAVALSGNRMIVGSLTDDTPSAHTSGSAYAFVRTATGWVEEDKFFPADVAILDRFGWQAALSGDRAFVSSLGDDDNGTSSGSVYVFERSGTSWLETQKLLASDGQAFMNFGWSLDVQGDTLVVGAHGSNAHDQFGQVYVFQRVGTSWVEQTILTASDQALGDRFGYTVAIHGDTVAVGALADDDGGMSSGSAYVFVRSGTAWAQQAKLTATDAVAFEYFGSSVDVFDDTIVIGGTDEEGNFDKYGGSAWVFTRSGTVWAQAAELASPSRDDRFGEHVQLEGDLVLVSAPEDDEGFPLDRFCNSGAIYAFERSGASWSQSAEIARDVPDCLDFFGNFAFEAGTLVVGLHNEFVGGLHAGAVLMFSVDGPSMAFCDASDGALDACPCANPGAPDSGCDNPAATGGVALELVGQDTALTRATLQGTGFPAMSAPTAILVRGAELDLSGPVVFGDGLRCVGVPSVRLAATLAAGGVSTHVFGHGAMAGAGTFYYQAWHRSTPVTFCDPTAAWNMSGGRTLTWP